MNRKQHMASCHPRKRNYAQGLCNVCYYRDKPKAARNKEIRDSQPGLVRTGVPGWGAI